MNLKRARRRGHGAVTGGGAAGAAFGTWQGKDEAVMDDPRSDGSRHPAPTSITRGAGTDAAVAPAIAQREAVR